MPLSDSLESDARELTADLVKLRRALHRQPEIGLILPRTQETLLAELDGLGLEVSTGTNLSSITAVLRGNGDSTTAVLLRADMDALPVQEATGVEFSSQVDGAMHACGHDLHMAMLVGAARLLSVNRDSLAGDVVFMLQPGEEGWDGAGKMIEEGILDAAGPRVGSAYGMHVMSGKYPTGMFTTRPGTLMAASGWLRVVVRGAGGHGSTPHLGRDPITAAAEMVTSLQTMVTRRFDPFDPVVVTVGRISAGTRRNIIPDNAEFDATVRTFRQRTWNRSGSTRRCCAAGSPRPTVSRPRSSTSTSIRSRSMTHGMRRSPLRWSPRCSAPTGSRPCSTRSREQRTFPGCWRRCPAAI